MSDTEGNGGEMSEGQIGWSFVLSAICGALFLIYWTDFRSQPEEMSWEPGQCFVFESGNECRLCPEGCSNCVTIDAKEAEEAVNDW